MTTAGNSDDVLPKDVIFGILIWLPVVSLLRCKAVCKSWRALIESPTFVTQHLHHHSEDGSNLIAMDVNPDDECQYLLLSGEKFEISINLDFDFDERQRQDQQWYPITEIGLCGSCNGIIGLRHYPSGDVALWNPATKQFRPLPPSPIPLRPAVTPANDLNEMYSAFGFDAKSNDYKVVRIILNVEDSEVNNTTQIEIYSLSTDSWRIIHRDNASFPVKYFVLDPVVSRKGMCSWLASDEYIPWSPYVFSFDLNDEVFGTMQLPDGCEGEKTYGLDFLNDKMTCIAGVRDRVTYCHETNFQIWVLHEYGVKDSWAKLYTVGPFELVEPVERITPTMLSNNGDSLLVRAFTGTDIESDMTRLFLYDIATQEMRDLYVQVLPCYHMMFIHYNESLVSIKGGAESYTGKVFRTEPFLS